MTDTAVVVQQQVATVVVEVLRTQVVALQTPSTAVAQPADLPPVVVQQGDTAIAMGMQPGALVVAPVLHSVVVAVGMQGPPGPDTVGALRQENLLGEFAQNPQAQQQAQKNIGLGVEDPLAYYILAKS